MSYKCYDFTDGTTFESIMSDMLYAVEDDSYYYAYTPSCDGDLCGETAIRIDKRTKEIKWFYEIDYAIENDGQFVTNQLYDDHQVTKDDIIKHFQKMVA